MAAVLRARNLDRDTELAARLAVADGLWDRFMGLMGRPGLEPDTGLWLTGTNGIHMMFMRFPIDAVFLAKPEQAAGAGGASSPAAGAGGAVAATRAVVSVHREPAGLDRHGPAGPWRERGPGAAGRDDRTQRDSRRRPDRAGARQILVKCA